MSRIETILSKARPIKKLCIIDDDFDLFCEINNTFTEEIGGFFNLILLNNDKLFSKNTIDFIKYHDPDIVINYSKCENDLLLAKFNVRIIDPKSQGNFNLNHFTIPIFVLDNIPDLVRSVFYETFNKIVVWDNQFKEPENSVNFVNLGSLSKEAEKEIQSNNIFRGVKIDNVQPRLANQDIFRIREENSNLLYVSTLLSRPTSISSIYSVNHNRNNYFSDEGTIIFGRSDDLESITYFWNTRATYPYSKLIWIPVELVDDYLYGIKKFNNFCIFSGGEELKDNLRNICEKFKEIASDKYYFSSSFSCWDSFEHLQNVAFNDDYARIIHPQSKLFSKSGFNVNIALEIRGFEETILPQSPILGRLFKQDDQFNKHHFVKIGSNGLAILLSDFAPYQESPLYEELKIPTDVQIFKEILTERGLTSKESKQSQIISQVINLLDGYQNIEILKDEAVFDLIVKIAPKRIDRIVKELSKELNASVEEEKLEDLICDIIGDISTIKSDTYIEADDFYSLAGGSQKVNDKKNFFSKIEKLYFLNLLLRGKKVICQKCGTTLWYPISGLQDDLQCYCCNNDLKIPIYNTNKAQNDSFKLNELICTAVDQGVLPVLLTTYLLHKQNYRAIRFIFDIEIYETGTLIGEIDILLTLGTKIGIVEVKADRGFETGQLDRILEMRKKIRADFIIFSTLKETDSVEIETLISYLNTKEINYPVFILTKDALFNEKVVDLSNYFHVDRTTNSFPNGVIIPEKYI